jgi:hypothetical protein
MNGHLTEQELCNLARYDASLEVDASRFDERALCNIAANLTPKGRLTLRNTGRHPARALNNIAAQKRGQVTVA